ncbi:MULTISPECIES: response regulator transcription factor [unclassified Crossiella]|uniref:response regulator n=1 Tax=unclassified Crossiella TaxID=2620835 RepID=UPI001FFF7F65|nr:MULTISPECIES: response regulator transcription factor [unclassified Crossiella]MCK2242992.1 response regulator transcription factor [Crossiella sp. S99.2]MCK2256869.1 response regulator transcription factor [Crossiella sp. S99.1]
MIRVVLADDQTLVRRAFALLLGSAPDLTVVAEAATGAEAVRAAREHRADVVVMDIRMPELDGVEATRQIAADEDLAGVRVLVLTTYDTGDNVVAALRAGASGFLVKDTQPAALLDAIRTVAAGESLLSPSATATLIARFRETPEPVVRQGNLSVLTARETEVLTLVAQGLTNHEIAARLVLSPLTVKTYLSRLLTKLDARDRVQLVILAYQAGLV